LKERGEELQQSLERMKAIEGNVRIRGQKVGRQMERGNDVLIKKRGGEDGIEAVTVGRTGELLK